MLILPEASLEETLSRARQIQREIKPLRVNFEGKLLEPITISAGVAVSPDHGNTSDALLKAADTALYQAKEAGRDCVVLFRG